MGQTTVHLEDVTRAARQGIALAIVASLLVLASMLAAGLPAVLAGASAAFVLAAGAASGGFGLVARLGAGRARPRRAARATRERNVAALRVAQPR